MSVKIYKIDWQDGDNGSFVGEVVSKSDYDKLESENRMLKAKLEKSMEQLEFVVEGFVKLGTISPMGRNEILAGIKQELDSITIDSIKRGEK